MPPRLNRKSLELLAAQSNVLAAWQQGAPNRRSIRRAVEQGHWIALTSRTYMAAPGNPTEEQLEWAAVLHAGSGALLSGQHCLQRYGWSGRVQGPIEVVMPRNRNLPGRTSFSRVHRVTYMPAARWRQGMPCVAPSAAVLQSAAWAATPREAMVVVVSSLQARVVSPSTLIRIVQAHPAIARRALVLEVAREFIGGVTSMNERAFSRLCRNFDIPPPMMQRRRKDAAGRARYLDAEFRTASGMTLIVEIDGVHHLDPQNWLDDIERHNSLALADPGVVILRVSSWTLRHEPEVFMTQLREALASL